MKYKEVYSMRKLLLILFLMICASPPASAAIGNVTQGPFSYAPLNVQDTSKCSSTSPSGSYLIQQFPLNTATAVISLNGTFSGTITVYLTANSGTTWTSAGTVSSTTPLSVVVAGYTHLCADVTTYTSGIIGTTISSSLGISATGGGGGITQVTSLPGTCTATSGPVQLTVAPYGIYVPSFTGTTCTYVLDSQIGGALLPGSAGVKMGWTVCSNSEFTVTSGSPTVTVSAPCVLPQFSAGAYEVFFTTYCGADTNYVTASAGPTTLTTATWVSATQMTLSQNANLNAGTTNTNCGKLAFGPPDDTTSGPSPWTTLETLVDGGLNCQNVQISGITEWEQAHFFSLSLPCIGLSGGTDSSKYPGVTGFGVGSGARILLPPWFAQGTCTGGTSSTACTGQGEWANITFDTLGQAGNITKNVNFFETANDGSYKDLAFWGGWAGSGSFYLGNGGAHITMDITVDGGPTPVTIAGNTNASYLFAANGKSVSATIVLTGTLRQDFGAIYTSVNSGQGINVGTQTYISFGGPNLVVTSLSSSSCLNTTTGHIFISGMNCVNTGNTASVGISVNGAGYAFVEDSVIQGGATGKAFNCAATAVCEEGSGNTYGANPTGLTPSCTFTSGGGTTPSCAIQTGSTNVKGVIIASTGTGAPGSTGTITLTFSSTESGPSGSAPSCVYVLDNSGTAWGNESVVFANTQSTTAPVLAWSNVATAVLTALATSSPYRIAYRCDLR